MTECWQFVKNVGIRCVLCICEGQKLESRDKKKAKNENGTKVKCEKSLEKVLVSSSTKSIVLSAELVGYKLKKNDCIYPFIFLCLLVICSWFETWINVVSIVSLPKL